MSQFKFTEEEIEKIASNFSLKTPGRPSDPTMNDITNFIEQIISARGESDGWVRVEELPSDFRGHIFTYGDNVGYAARIISEEYRMPFYVTHYQIPSPPKPDQQ